MLRPDRCIVAVAIALVGCCCAPTNQGLLSHGAPDQSQTPKWFPSSRLSPRGTALVVHGLNLRPSSMDEIAEHIASLGLDTYRLALAGHADTSATGVTAGHWDNDIAEAFKVAKQRRPGKPVYVFGYSLGGLLAVHFLSEHPEVRPKAMILLAPAISLKLMAQSIVFTSLFPNSELTLPSMAPPQYRRLPGTPLRWYHNLRLMLNEVSPLVHPENLAAIPTIVVGNPRDELVSLTGIQRWIDDSSLSKTWCIAKLYPSPKNPSLPEHLMIDRNSLGAAQWEHLITLIALGFGETSHPCP